MARIKIEEVPVLEDLSAKELEGITGGVSSLTVADGTRTGTGQVPAFRPEIDDEVINGVIVEDMTRRGD